MCLVIFASVHLFFPRQLSISKGELARGKKMLDILIVFTCTSSFLHCILSGLLSVSWPAVMAPFPYCCPQDHVTSPSHCCAILACCASRVILLSQIKQLLRTSLQLLVCGCCL